MAWTQHDMMAPATCNSNDGLLAAAKRVMHELNALRTRHLAVSKDALHMCEDTLREAIAKAERGR